MGMYPTCCVKCGQAFMWFSGNPNQHCFECTAVLSADVENFKLGTSVTLTPKGGFFSQIPNELRARTDKAIDEAWERNR